MPENTVVPPSSSAVRGVRRAAIIAIIASLSIAAALGILVLVGGGFGEVQAKVLTTTLTVAAFGTTALCHLAVVTRRVRIVGFVGIGASAAAALFALVLIWLEWGWSDSAEWWLKSFGLLTILAVSLAHANLLLLLAARPQPVIRIPLAVTLAAVAVVAVMLGVPILTNGDVGDGDVYWRVFGVVAILDALGTVALPVLGLVVREPAAPEAASPSREQLTLTVSPELAARLDEAAAGAGVPREQFAVDAITRAVEGADAR